MNGTTMDLEVVGAGLLVARLVIGLLMAAHGAQKLLGWFGGYGLNKTGEFFIHLGFKQGRLFAAAASLGEITSGLLIALGFLGPVGPAIMIGIMIVAAISVHWQNGLFATGNGIEVPLLYAAAAFALAFTGFGSFSLDALFGLTGLWTSSNTVAALVIGALGGAGNLVIRKRTPAAA